MTSRWKRKVRPHTERLSSGKGSSELEGVVDISNNNQTQSVLQRIIVLWLAPGFPLQSTTRPDKSSAFLTAAASCGRLCPLGSRAQAAPSPTPTLRPFIDDLAWEGLNAASPPAPPMPTPALGRTYPVRRTREEQVTASGSESSRWRACSRRRAWGFAATTTSRARSQSVRAKRFAPKPPAVQTSGRAFTVCRGQGTGALHHCSRTRSCAPSIQGRLLGAAMKRGQVPKVRFVNS